MPSLEWNSYRTAVDQQLQRQGLVAAGSGERAPLLVRISFDRVEQLPDGRRSPVSVGVGGSTGRYGSGVGPGIGINLGGSSEARRVGNGWVRSCSFRGLPEL